MRNRGFSLVKYLTFTKWLQEITMVWSRLLMELWNWSICPELLQWRFKVYKILLTWKGELWPQNHEPWKAHDARSRGSPFCRQGSCFLSQSSHFHCPWFTFSLEGSHNVQCISLLLCLWHNGRYMYTEKMKLISFHCPLSKPPSCSISQ